jgi:predicted nucleic acid-binding protein
VQPLVLADTNVWIEFARDRHALLRELLRGDRVVAHDAVVGELTLGCGPRISRLADYVATLPLCGGLLAPQIRAIVRDAGIPCTGIGWCDACLLAECAASGGRVRLLTEDRALQSAANRIGVSYG